MLEGKAEHHHEQEEDLKSKLLAAENQIKKLRADLVTAMSGAESTEQKAGNVQSFLNEATIRADKAEMEAKVFFFFTFYSIFV